MKPPALLTYLANWPICARCNKPVDEVRTAPDDLTRCLAVVVFCHGASERIAIPDEILDDAKSLGDLRFDGPCFVNNAIARQPEIEIHLHGPVLERAAAEELILRATEAWHNRTRPLVLKPPPAPPRWTNPSGYMNGKSCWEIEREFNELTGGLKAWLRRRWLSFLYGSIHIWTPDERRVLTEYFSASEGE